MATFLQLFFIFGFISLCSASSCESPKYSSSGYSTVDGFFHYQTTYIVEFALQCSNNVKDTQFYAVVNGKIYPVATSEETSKYQVSWLLEHSDSNSQTFDVKIYDEDKFVEYKKVEQSGGDVSSVQPLFTVSHYHAGVSRKSWVSSETVFLLLAVVAIYFATKFKAEFKS